MVTNSDNGLSFRRTDLEAIFAVCGDGIQQAGEDCDDGNLANGDCCSDACAFETSGSACSDADACTTPDACDGAGGCVSGAPLVCDDGAYCNGVESCDSMSGCQAGTPPTLGDGVTCTIDACDETNDVVTHTPDASACDDGLFCNGVETCHPVNDCEVGAAPDLDDGVVCTVDTCDEDNDLVVHTPDDGGCSDGLFCNGPETCHPVNDCEAGVPPSLGDGVACTVDTCDELADVSVHTPDDAFCDDGDPCTAESCDELFGCVTEPGTLCPVAVPGSRPMGLFLLAGALVLLGSAWLSLARSDRAIWLRGSPR